MRRTLSLQPGTFGTIVGDPALWLCFGPEKVEYTLLLARISQDITLASVILLNLYLKADR
jgi:hypothetical protein